MKKLGPKENIKTELKPDSKVWLVTGSASGLGRHIAEAVLASGDRLLATAPDPGRLEDLVKLYGDQVRIAPLDAADEAAASAAVQAAMAAFGRLDVVVNNAGYGDVAPFEQVNWEGFKALVDANFYGVVRVTRAALPVMRNQRNGCIIQISSVGGRLAIQGSTGYHAAKWDVGGFTEALAQEAAPFGVKICALEPGGMRTDSDENSSLAKVAQAVLRLAASDRLPAHLLLGPDDVHHAVQPEVARGGEAERWREIGVTTDLNVPVAGTRSKRGGIRACADVVRTR